MQSQDAINIIIEILVLLGQVLIFSISAILLLGALLIGLFVIVDFLYHMFKGDGKMWIEQF